MKMKDIEFLDEPENTFLFWGTQKRLQDFINFLNAAKVYVHAPEEAMTVSGVDGFTLELQTPMQRDAAEMLIKKFEAI